MVSDPSISVVIPFYNEEENVENLVRETISVVENIPNQTEIICIDDGSSDSTFQILEKLAQEFSILKLVKFRFNAGQTAGIQAGIDHAAHEIVIPMDGDGQNDPNEIPRLTEKLKEGYDVVSGWRKNRKDKAISRKLPSWVANKLVSKITKVKLHDFGCSMKAYKKEYLQDFRLYGEMHRFIPVYAKNSGAKITELPVNHRPRTAGKSKYGINRTFKVVLDLLTINFLSSYQSKPIYFFGRVGFLGLFLAFLCGVWVIIDKIFKIVGEGAIVENPVTLLMILLAIIGFQFMALGILSEIIMRTYFESQNKSAFRVKKLVNFPNHNTD